MNKQNESCHNCGYVGKPSIEYYDADHEVQELTRCPQCDQILWDSWDEDDLYPQQGEREN